MLANDDMMSTAHGPEEVPAESVSIEGSVAVQAPANEIANHFEAINSRLDELQRSFDQKLKYDAQKDETIRVLHADLDLHRQGIHLSVLRPLVTDLMRLYDDLSAFVRRFAAEARVGGPLEHDRNASGVVKELEIFLDEIVEMLSRNGFAIYGEPGTLADPQRYTLQAIEVTSDSSRDKHIAQIIRRGLIYHRPDGNEQVIRAAIATIYRFESHGMPPELPSSESVLE